MGNLLHAAVKQGGLAGVNKALQGGADVDVEDNDGNTAVKLAAESGKLDVVRYLVEERGADVNVKNNDGNTVLIKAAESGKLDVVRYLVEERGADVNDTDKYGNTVLIKAASRGKLDVVRYLVEEGGADVNDTDMYGNTVLIKAASRGKLDVVRYLVEEGGADVNVKNWYGNTAMKVASRGHWDVVLYLMERGADVMVKDKYVKTVLIKAASRGKLDVVRYLVEDRGDVNVKDNNGETALMYAAESGKLDVVRYLVEERGADVNVKNNDGNTVLIKAAESGKLDVVRYLVEERGADVNDTDKYGNTVLIKAASRGKLDVVRYLVEEGGADVNVKDKHGSTALMKAASRGELDVVRYLVESGADVDIKNIKNESALSLATKRGYIAIQNSLLRRVSSRDDPTNAAQFSAASAWFISLEKIQINQFEPLGTGGFGQVFRGKFLNSDVVVKEICISGSGESRGPYSCSKSQSARTTTSTISRVTGRFASTSTDADTLRAFKREADIWFRLNHPHIVQLFGACDKCFPPIFVCEFATNGSLDKYLHLHPDQIWRKLYEVALGVSYLHERGIVHADLKCDNIVVGSDLKAKVTDFGLSSVLRQTEEEDVQISGAVQWVAPECLGDDRVPATFISDIYSLGMCIIEAMRVVENSGLDWKDNQTKRVPWTDFDDSTVRVYVKERKELPFRPHISTDEQWALVEKMCAHEPSQRINIADVVFALEKFAKEDHQETLDDFDSYRIVTLNQLWAETKSMMHQYDTTAFEQLVFCELEAVFTRIQQSQFSHEIFDRFRRIVVSFNEAIPHGFRQYRIMDLTSKSAQVGRAAHVTRQIDELRRITGAPSIGTNTLSSFANQGIDLFVSADPPMWVLSRELASSDDRRAFRNFLSSELEDSESNYTKEQVGVIRSAYDELADISGETFMSETTPKWFIPWYELVFERYDYMDSNSFGRVYCAQWLKSDVVVKQLRMVSNRGRSSSIYSDVSSTSIVSGYDESADIADIAHNYAMFKREVEIWFSLSHPHVIRLYGACYIGEPFCVCEYATNGSLKEYLGRHPDEIWQKLYETALGMQYLHERGIIHGDLKCKNVVVASDGTAKVTDFRLSTWSDLEDDKVVISGAWQWMAPECIESGASKLSFASDVYSLGMCIVEALRVVEDDCRWPYPWGDVDSDVVSFMVVRRRELPPRPRFCTDEQWQLVERMCAHDPDKRIKISTVVDGLAIFARR